MLQQHLSFTVLKRDISDIETGSGIYEVATVLTVYCIETLLWKRKYFLRIDVVATVPTVHGIETSNPHSRSNDNFQVTTVLTVYGIETFFWKHREHINRKLVAIAYGMRRRV